MKKKYIKRIVLFAMLFLTLTITFSHASYNASNKTVTSGEKVTISITSTQALDAYNLDLKNAGGLTFVSCSKAKESESEITNIQEGKYRLYERIWLY